jgi:hypothetical protein
MPTHPSVLLFTDNDVLSALQLDPADLDALCAQRQLLPIIIRGKRRFLREEIERLVKVYQSVQHRTHHEQTDQSN